MATKWWSERSSGARRARSESSPSDRPGTEVSFLGANAHHSSRARRRSVDSPEELLDEELPRQRVLLRTALEALQVGKAQEVRPLFTVVTKRELGGVLADSGAVVGLEGVIGPAADGHLGRREGREARDVRPATRDDGVE